MKKTGKKIWWIKKFNLFFSRKKRLRCHAGFTMMELIVASAVMLVVILGALAFYSRSNRVSVDQQQYAELQHDVRSAMYFMTRDVRMAGSGLPPEFGLYALEGFNNEDQGGEVKPDRIRLLGNMEDPLNIRIQQYQGASVTVSVDDGSFEQYPYPAEFYPAQPCFHLSHRRD